MNEKKNHGRWVVGICDKGIYLAVSDEPLDTKAGEYEFQGEPRAHLTNQAIARIIAGGKPAIFTERDQSFGELAAPMY